MKFGVLAGRHSGQRDRVGFKKDLKYENTIIIFSSDNCATWSAPQPICADVGRYYVLENSRLVQLSTGRIIFPIV